MLTINKTYMKKISPFLLCTYSLKSYNKETTIQDLLLDFVNIIYCNNYQRCNNYQKRDILLKFLYHILQKTNFILKFNFKIDKNLKFNAIPNTNCNYLFILNDNTILQFNFNFIEKLLTNEKKLSFLYYYLNLNQDIINNNFSYNNHFDFLLRNQNSYQVGANNQKIFNTSLYVHTNNMCTKTIANLSNLSNNLFKSFNTKNSNERVISIKNNRKNKEEFFMNKRKSFHSDINFSNVNIKKINSKRNRFHSNFKKLNYEISSKYHLYQKEKEQFKSIISQAYSMMDKSNDNIYLSDKDKVKKFFKGKYFKNLYQKLNLLQNNLRDYVNNENYDFKSEQGHFCEKFLGLKNIKPINCNMSQQCHLNHIDNKKNTLTTTTSLAPFNLSEKSINKDIVNINQTKFNNISNESNSTNLSVFHFSLKPYCLSPKVTSAVTITTTINIESQTNNNNNKDIKEEFNHSIQILKDSTQFQCISNNDLNHNKTLVENGIVDEVNNNNLNHSEKNSVNEIITSYNDTRDVHNNKEKSFQTSNVDVIEKSMELSSKEIFNTSFTNNSNNLLLKSDVSTNNESVKDIKSSSNVKKNRRSKHNRSSAVCLSSNDIKGILKQTKKEDINCKPIPPSKRNLNESIKYHENNNVSYSNKEYSERRKLLSRNCHHPSLNIINTSQFCYNDYYPSVRLPFNPRNPSFYQQQQQQWINRRRLNV
ncbi:hypothetical protein BCR32DRAFT_293571 [Anaeromyces robustus]|uniref:Uncharacterized protein n=1 Tax=Anaeromyces robustus TaxID=1754192 RepID=A0A1Y1X530_9FUNG|nr:hypothetical protein BCR32DRAFT_293571 [Anaeromyces robustus]|eukprot:ORX80930.1 hypothetical protein BCR32DRAFT_293571 [Anaeromyces robustus]